MKNNIRKIHRSGSQPCPICDRQTALEQHHMRGRNIANPHHESNIVWICPTCHSECHLGWIVIEGWFKTTDGRELIWRNVEDESITGQICIPPLVTVT